MSHSDSELNKSRDDYRKKLHVDFKPLTHASRLARSREKHLRNKMRQLRNRKVITAVGQNNVEVVTAQLDLGAHPNCADVHGRSALHIAASKGYTDVVKVLLQKGANPNLNDKLMNTPLHLAACTHNLSVISLLLQAGADVRKLDLYGKNPLQLAQSKLQLLQRSWREGSIEMIQVRTELQLIIDILIAVLKRSTPQSNIDELMRHQMLNLNMNSESVDDQMSQLLQELEGFNIS